MRRDAKTWVGRIVGAGLVVFTLGYVPYHLYTRSGFARMLELRQDLSVLRARNADLRAETDRMQREVDGLRDDATAIERVARTELGWVRPGEIIVDLSRPASSSSRGFPTTRTGTPQGPQ